MQRRAVIYAATAGRRTGAVVGDVVTLVGDCGRTFAIASCAGCQNRSFEIDGSVMVVEGAAVAGCGGVAAERDVGDEGLRSDAAVDGAAVTGRLVAAEGAVDDGQYPHVADSAAVDCRVAIGEEVVLENRGAEVFEEAPIKSHRGVGQGQKFHGERAAMVRADNLKLIIAAQNDSLTAAIDRQGIVDSRKLTVDRDRTAEVEVDGVTRGVG